MLQLDNLTSSLGGYEMLKGKMPEFVVPNLKGFTVMTLRLTLLIPVASRKNSRCMLLVQLKPYVSREPTPKP